MKTIDLGAMAKQLEDLGTSKSDIQQAVYQLFYCQEHSQPMEDLLEAFDEMLEEYDLELVVGIDASTVTYLQIDDRKEE